MPTSIRYAVTSARSALKASSSFNPLRARGRERLTTKSAPKLPSGFRHRMRSASTKASSTSLVISTAVRLSAAQIASISKATLPRVSASSADRGSSISSTSGCIASARATATRCRMPPDNSAGR
ncbi:MAG: hypothetical protein ACD_54C00743G0001, partial [uncultured bacterium]